MNNLPAEHYRRLNEIQAVCGVRTKAGAGMSVSIPYKAHFIGVRFSFTSGELCA